MPTPKSVHLGLDLDPSGHVATVIACSFRGWNIGKLLWDAAPERVTCRRCKRTLAYKLARAAA